MRPNPEVLYQQVGDEALLVHLGTNRIYAFNRSGAAIWTLLAAGRDVPQIRQALLSGFDVEPDQLGRDLDDVLTLLRKEDLVIA